jgi:amino-acid N-acetyltransferase
MTEENRRPMLNPQPYTQPAPAYWPAPGPDGVTIRPARLAEVGAMLVLFEDEVRAGRMLPRNPDNARQHIDNWLVAVEGSPQGGPQGAGRVVGCVSLVRYNKELCELRSLAVHPDARGRGVGHALIRAALELARQRGVKRVLALTRAVPLFEKAGFRRDFVANFPEKVWRDCAPCPFKEACDEVALIVDLAAPGQEPPGSRNGNGRRE